MESLGERGDNRPRAGSALSGTYRPSVELVFVKPSTESIMRIPLALVLATLLGSSAVAQTTVTGTPAAPDAKTSQQSGGQESVTRPNTDKMTPGGTGTAGTVKLEKGANSFTEGEARSRLAKAGYTDAKDLKKDADGIWRGTATHGGQSVQVGLDFKGNVSAQ
jgi:periplasmic protein CpxP/Spy